MKRYNNLYDEICSPDNIRAAILSAAKHRKYEKHKLYKGFPKPRESVWKILDNLDENVEKLSKIMRSETYEFHPNIVDIRPDTGSGKLREIHISQFWPDLCIYWAVFNVIEPIITKSFYVHSCASVKGKGIKHAHNTVWHWVTHDHKNTKYYLYYDIHHFYQSIPNNEMKALFRTKFKDTRLLWLLDTIIDRDDGLPIGNPLSQCFANWYVTEMDYYIKQHLGAVYYVRYMDDCIIFGPNKKRLHLYQLMINQWLEDKGLEMKPNYQVCRFDKEPLDFVGYRFYRSKISMRKKTMYRMSKRASNIHKKKVNGQEITFKDAAGILSYIGWIKTTDTRKMFDQRVTSNVSIIEMKNIVRRDSRARNAVQKHREAERMGHNVLTNDRVS